MIYPSQKRTLDELLAEMKRVRSGGIILCGDEGIGKSEIAAAAISELLGLNRIDGEHPGLERVLPDETMATKPITAERIRKLIDIMRLTAVAGPKRIGLIAPADAMTNQAANAILKTLEEPPADAIILLVAHQPSLLPATIRSRCQIVHCLPPTIAEASSGLMSEGASKEDTELALALAAGKPGLATKLLGSLDNYKAIVKQIASKEPWERLMLIPLGASLAKDYESAKMLISALVWRAQRFAAGDTLEAADKVEIEALKVIGQKGPSGIDTAWRICQKIIEDTEKGNLDNKYAVYRMLLALAHGSSK